MTLVDSIISFEAGELDIGDTLELFSELICSGMAWRLQGSYGRAAHSLIERGVISREGEIDHARAEEMLS